MNQHVVKACVHITLALSLEARRRHDDESARGVTSPQGRWCEQKGLFSVLATSSAVRATAVHSVRRVLAMFCFTSRAVPHEPYHHMDVAVVAQQQIHALVDAEKL